MTNALYCPEIPLVTRKRVHRGSGGRWVFCLAELNHRKYPGKFKLKKITDYTDEASARVYFDAELKMGNCFILKLQEKTAASLFVSGEKTRRPFL